MLQCIVMCQKFTQHKYKYKDKDTQTNNRKNIEMKSGVKS